MNDDVFLVKLFQNERNADPGQGLIVAKENVKTPIRTFIFEMVKEFANEQVLNGIINNSIKKYTCFYRILKIKSLIKPNSDFI